MTLIVKWLSQSCFWLRTTDLSVYFDPGFLNTSEPLQRADMILVSHHHFDHLLKGSVSLLADDWTSKVGPMKCRRKLGKNAQVVKPGDHIDVKGTEVQVVDAYNPKQRYKLTYHKKGACVGYVIMIDGRWVYHAGDTGLIDEMSDLGPVDLALLPIGGKVTMGVDEAVEAVKRIRPMMVVPMHMKKADPMEFKNKVEKIGETQVSVLGPNEMFSF
ncbi:MAG: MBL fold metallo-hydrolase [Methanomassiliicoccales archaeon]|jgi:L-ascorbate metabolism protein UlaG (beta-lactamase superfamily)